MAVSAPGRLDAQDLAALDLSSEKEDLLALINEYRQENGQASLELNSSLQAAAQWLSGDMADKNYLSHIDSLGRDASTRMASFGYAPGGATGENIAGGYATAAAVLQGWQGSPGHNANLLSPAYQVIGIGLAFDASATYEWYWTADFGSVQTDPPTPTAIPDRRTGPVLAFPNPARDRVTFPCPQAGSGQLRVDVYNPTGERVVSLQTSFPVPGVLVWDVRGFASGVYTYRSVITYDQGGRSSGVGKLAVIR